MARRVALPRFKDSVEEAYEDLQDEIQKQIDAEGLPDILDYIPRISPSLMSPRHLEPMLRYVRKYETEPFKLVFSVPPRHGKPLAGGTLVRMADGTQHPIRALRPGDRVVSGTGRPTTVEAVYPQGQLPVWRVRTASGGVFLAEGSHRFLTRRGWQRVDELRARAGRRDALLRCLDYELDAPGRPVGISTRHIPWGARLCAGRWEADEVVEVAPAGKLDCWCITVVEDESFLVASDFVTHNTETLLHLVPWMLRKNPKLRIGYATYSQALARKQAIKVMNLCKAAGIRMATKKVMDWETPAGGGFVATSIGGTATGLGFDILIIDDPTKDRLTAESRIYRDRIWDWFLAVAFTRVMPNGSIIVCGTRWHEDDLQGRLVKGYDERDPWPYVNLPAIIEDEALAERTGRKLDTALWEEFWPKATLLRNKRIVGPYEWASLYQGMPTPRGGTVFNEPSFWNALPTGGYRVTIGLDLAYSEKSRRDHSVAAVGYYVPAEDVIYVVNVIRVQQTAPPEFKALLYERLKQYTAPGTCTWRFYGSGTEIGSAAFMRTVPNPLPIQIVPAVGDKFIRSIPYAAAWNEGRVRVPSPDFIEQVLLADQLLEEQGLPGKTGHLWEWRVPFVLEHRNFTGKKASEEDDQVDAGAAMHDAARPPKPLEPPKPKPITSFTSGSWTR